MNDIYLDGYDAWKTRSPEDDPAYEAAVRVGEQYGEEAFQAALREIERRQEICRTCRVMRCGECEV